MKYNVGDKVRIKNIDWYKENRDENGSVLCNYNYYFTRLMTKYCGEVMTIKDIINVPLCRCYMFEEDEFMCHFTDDMIEGLVEEETKPLTYEETVEIIEAMQGVGDSWECPQGYQFIDENGNVINATKIVLEKKSPKTNVIIKWLRECDMTKYIGVIYSGMCSITFDTEKLIKDITEIIRDE